MLNEDIGSYADGQSERHVRRGTMKGDYAAGQEKTPGRKPAVMPICISNFSNGPYCSAREMRFP